MTLPEIWAAREAAIRSIPALPETREANISGELLRITPDTHGVSIGIATSHFFIHRDYIRWFLAQLADLCGQSAPTESGFPWGPEAWVRWDDAGCYRVYATKHNSDFQSAIWTGGTYSGGVECAVLGDDGRQIPRDGHRHCVTRWPRLVRAEGQR